MAFCTVDHQAASIDRELDKLKDVVNPPIYFGSLTAEYEPSLSMLEVFPLPQLQPYQSNCEFKFMFAQAKKIYKSYDWIFKELSWYGDFSEMFKPKLTFNNNSQCNFSKYWAFGFNVSEVLEQIPSMLEAIFYYHYLEPIPKNHYDQVIEDLKNYILVHLNVFGFF